MTTHVTKIWMEDGKLVVQVIPQEQIYKREWVDLTGEELETLLRENRSLTLGAIWAVADKLKDKNT